MVQALSLYRRFSKRAYELRAVTVDLGFPADYSALADFCAAWQVPYTLVPTQIGPIVFESRQEKNPCSLCANMRRGALNSAAKSLGCNKVALGHNREDALETLLLSWLYEGRLHTFQPKSYLDRREITVIRPMVLVPEKELLHVSRSLTLPVLTSPCPAAGRTKRQDIKNLMRELNRQIPGATERMMHGLVETEQYGLWD